MSIRMSNGPRVLSALLSSLLISSFAAAHSEPMTSNSPPLKVQVGEAELPPTERVRLTLYDPKPIACKTKFGAVLCAPDSAVFVLNTTRSSAVFVLDERKKGDVQILVDGHVIASKAGEEILLSKQKDATFADLDPRTGISYRNAGELSPIGEVRVFKAEFFLAQAYEHIPAIAELSSSSDPKKQKLLKRLLKNAAALQGH